MIGKHKKYFKVKNRSIIKNLEEIENAIFKAGTIVMICYGKKIDKIKDELKDIVSEEMDSEKTP